MRSSAPSRPDSAQRRCPSSGPGMEARDAVNRSSATLSAGAGRTQAASIPIDPHRPPDAWSLHAGDHRFESGWGYLTARIARRSGFFAHPRDSSRVRAGSDGSAMEALAHATRASVVGRVAVGALFVDALVGVLLGRGDRLDDA